MTSSLALPYSPARGRKHGPSSSKQPRGVRGRSASVHRHVVKRITNVRANWFALGVIFSLATTSLHGSLSEAVSTAWHSTQATVSATFHSIEMPQLAWALPSLPQWPDVSFSSAPSEPVIVAVDTGEFHGPNLPEYPKNMRLTVDSGDTLMQMLVREEVQYDEANDVIAALRKTYNPRDLKAGQEIDLALDRHPDEPEKAIISELSIKLDPVESVELSRLPSGAFSVERASKPLSTDMVLASGKIHNSLFETGHENGVPTGVLAEMVKAYSYDVDFQREIQRGDEMEVLFERKVTDDGTVAGFGDMEYAKLKLHGKPLKIYRYQSADGNISYYNETGEGIIKALLRTPINGARISSGFGMRRHPILGYSKMHRGTDFAAPKGTPIYAAGDGVVELRGWVNGYGNFVKIKHNGTYATGYGHMSAFARNIGRGSRVKQGQIIGYVGMTGRATGPHLHYEVFKYGAQVNPLQEKFKTGITLAGKELQNFKAHVAKVDQQVAMMPRNTSVASR